MIKLRCDDVDVIAMEAGTMDATRLVQYWEAQDG
jgi:hypothetical protein